MCGNSGQCGDTAVEVKPLTVQLCLFWRITCIGKWANFTGDHRDYTVASISGIQTITTPIIPS